MDWTDINMYITYGKYVLYLGLFALVIYFLNLRAKITKSVGWNFINEMGDVKMKKDKDIVLRIKSPAGKEIYYGTKQSAVMKYPWKEKGKEVEKIVLFDTRAVDYINGIPIINVTPTDIRPIDRELGTLVNIPAEVINKLVVDSTKTAEADQKKDKTIKTLTTTVIVLALLMIVGLAYINQTNAEVQAELMRCTIELGKSATVTTG